MTFTWADINDLALKNGRHKAFFTCTDDDIGNHSVALMLSKPDQHTPIVVRIANWPMPAIEAPPGIEPARPGQRGYSQWR